MFYENATWDGNFKNKIKTIYHCKHCIAVDLILKQNQKGTMLGRVKIYLFIQLTWSDWVTSHGRLHYDRKFQIFIFLIRHNNVNKGVFCLIISYLQIKSYNVLNYNNCSTDWSFPLRYWKRNCGWNCGLKYRKEFYWQGSI